MTNPHWQQYLATLPADHPHHTVRYSAWGFGDGPQMADELGKLVVQGVKTATASLFWEYEHDGDPLPQVGDMSLVLDGQERPLCVIETKEVTVKPFNEVDAQFAYDEGEGNRTLAYWREVHWQFFSRACERIGREPTQAMPVVGERFRIVFLFPSS